MDFKT